MRLHQTLIEDLDVDGHGTLEEAIDHIVEAVAPPSTDGS
jgi:hypothetical protein